MMLILINSQLVAVMHSYNICVRIEITRYVVNNHIGVDLLVAVKAKEKLTYEH